MNLETCKSSEPIDSMYEFNDTLSFVSEICEVPCVFITFLDSKNQLNISKIGFEFLTIPENILSYNQNIIEQGAFFTISDLKKDLKRQSEKSNLSEFDFDFFAGIPILNDENLVIGTICILDIKSKELSAVQLKTLEYSAKQIKFKLEQFEKNESLLNKIQEKETQFQLFIDNSKEIFYELDRDGIIIDVSKNWTTFLGYEVDEVIGRSNSIFLHPKDLEMVTAFLNKTIETEGIENEITYRILHKDGHYAWHTSTIKLSEKDGKLIYIGNCRDVTEHFNIEQKNLQQKEFYEKILNQIPTDVAVFDQNHKYLYLNLAAIKDKELREFIVGKDDFEYAKHTGRDDSSAKNRRKKFSEALESKTLIEWEDSINSLNTGLSSYHTRIFNPIFDKDGTFEMMIGFGVDITERKQIELQNKLLTEENNKNKAIQLNEAKNRYRFLAENSVDLICLHNLDTSFQYISPSVINILGYNPEEMEGKSPLDYAHPEDLKHLKDIFADFIDEKVNKTAIARFKNKDGSYIWLETKANIVKEKDIKTGFQSSSRDITSRKEEEEVIEKTLLKQRELNELRSNLVSTISHEFRTPMTTIRASVELISIYLEGINFEKKQRLENQLNTITGEIDRIVELMNSVLTISKNDAGKTNFNPVKFNLKQLCLDVIETSFHNQKNGNRVQTLFKGSNFDVFADRNLMEYSIFNLLNNAFKYSEESGDIILNLTAISSEVTIEIIDFGIGIPEEDQHKLFNTFFRASNTNGIAGTGLGLYIVKTFTEKNSGRIQLESLLGKGTKVRLIFPAQNV